MNKIRLALAALMLVVFALPRLNAGLSRVPAGWLLQPAVTYACPLTGTVCGG